MDKLVSILSPLGKGMLGKIGRYLAIVLLLFFLFWSLKAKNYELGDSALLIQLLTVRVHTVGYHITYDEPMELYIHSIAYGFLHEAFGWSVDQAYALLSSIAGIVTILVLMSLVKFMTTDRIARLTILVLWCSAGAMQLFFGYLENYTLTMAGLILYIFLALRYLEGKNSILWPSLALSASFCLHVLSGWLFPSLIYLLFSTWQRNELKDNLKRLLIMIGGVLLPIFLTVGYCSYIGFGPKYMKYTHLARMKFVPLLDSSFIYYHYRTFSLEHITDILNEVVLTSMPGLILGIYLVLFSRERVVLKDRKFMFLFTVFVFTLLFAILWNSDLGFYRDWDLFAVVSIGIVPLAAYSAVTLTESLEKMKHLFASIIVLSSIYSFTWIYSNAVAEVPVNDLHDVAHIILGNELSKNGDLQGAIEEYREALRINSGNPTAHLKLATALLNTHSHKNEIIYHFEESLRLAPNQKHALQIRAIIDRLKGVP